MMQVSVCTPVGVAGGVNVTGKAAGAVVSSHLLERLKPYLPGILLFVVATVVGLFTYKDYGISWDEITQRNIGLLSYQYAFEGSKELLSFVDRRYGPGYELLLVFFEKLFWLSDSREIFLFRHIATHLLFLLSALSLYILAYRLYKNQLVASLGFVMLVCMPRIYAHSFFNTKDLPFLSLFLITMTVCQFAFEKNKTLWYFILGMLCGYTTSIRILGIMLAGFILFFLILDLTFNIINKEPLKKQLLNTGAFLFGFCLLLYIPWPFLWAHPFTNFAEGIQEFSRYHWDDYILVNGVQTTGMHISCTYFPSWFFVTNPELWLIAGIAGIAWLAVFLLKNYPVVLRNSRERTLLLLLLCFFTPICAVIFLHSVIYNDWRHLYFIYPSFILIALFAIDQLLQTRYKLLIQGLCIVQTIVVVVFMVVSHPFDQVYFNNFVSHKPGYLHKNYEMDYWGTSYKQALEHLLQKGGTDKIKINCYFDVLLNNNLLVLPEEDRARFQLADIDDAEYFITNFWGETYKYNFPAPEYSATVLGSPVFSIYKLQQDSSSKRKYREAKIVALKKFKIKNPNNYHVPTQIGYAYFRNNQYDSAENYALQALRLNPTDFETINNLATLYGKQKKYQPAIDLYKNAIVLFPGNAIPYTRTGLTYMYLTQYDSAVFYLGKAIAVDPGYNPSYEIMANTYKSAGKADSAKKYEAIARRNNPNFKL